MSGWHRPTAEAATGHWRGIMLDLGMPERFLSGRNGPCPFCEGRDRWRWLNTEGRGTWICSQCGAGDGFQLAERFTGLEFKEVAARIDAIIGNLEPDAPKRDMGADDVARMMREVVAKSRPVESGDLVSRYLASRGLHLPSVPSALRFAPGLRDGEGGVRPAMVASVRDSGGKPVTLHRTFLRPDGAGKAEMAISRKVMPGGMPESYAVRLFDSGPALGVAEGIETALAAHLIHDVPVWACLNAGNLVKFRPPENVERVMIFADNDSNFTGQEAAFRLARKCVMRDKIKAEVHVAGDDFREPTGDDWNDVLENLRDDQEERAAIIAAEAI